MERIKQAVERARAERLGQDGAQATVGQPKPMARSETPKADGSLRLMPRPIKVFWESLYEHRVVGGPEATALVDSYRILRTRILQRLGENGACTLGITSANAGEGKSLTAVNLAISIAKKTPVLLIDADLRRPSLHRFFDVELSVGLAECLAGKSRVEECVFSPSIEGLTLLPGGASTMNSSELLASSKMLELVESLKRTDDGALIIFDLPPLLTTDDALAFSPQLGAVLMVVEEGRIAPADLSRATDLLKNTHFLGTVLNKSTQPHQAYYG